MVRSADGSDRAFPDPDNIVVGIASDLTLQVQCLSEAGSGTEMITWQYWNGSMVPTGLEAFGVSQGMGGVLRIHPVAELENGNQFLCSDGNGNNLNVTFSMGEPTLLYMWVWLL